MGDSKVTKADMFELARQVANDINLLGQRLHGLSVTFDCLMTVLGRQDAVKAELERRIEAAKTKPPEPVEQTPLISVP